MVTVACNEAWSSISEAIADIVPQDAYASVRSLHHSASLVLVSLILSRNMVTSLIEHEQIKTTLPKAREAARLAEKVIFFF